LQAGAPLPANTPLSLANAVSFNNSAVAFAGPNVIILSGTVSLGGANNTLSVSGPGGGSAGQVILSGQVTGAGNLTKPGAGTLFLSNAVGAASTYAGQTLVAGGFLNAQSATALGANAANVVVASGSTLQLQAIQALANGFAMAHPLFLNGNGTAGTGALENVFGLNSVTAAVTLNTTAAIGVDAGILTQSGGVLGGPADLTKLGGGTLALSGANTYLGQTNINNGVVQVNSAAALGAV